MFDAEFVFVVVVLPLVDVLLLLMKSLKSVPVVVVLVVPSYSWSLDNDFSQSAKRKIAVIKFANNKSGHEIEFFHPPVKKEINKWTLDGGREKNRLRKEEKKIYFPSDIDRKSNQQKKKS